LPLNNLLLRLPGQLRLRSPHWYSLPGQVRVRLPHWYLAQLLTQLKALYPKV
jgi:hypothetical protein